MLQNHEVSASEKGMSRRSFLGYGAIGAGLLGASLAGCGKKGSDATTPVESGSDTAAAEVDADGFVVKATKTDGKSADNDLVIAIEGTIQNLHPMNWSDGNSGNVCYYMYETMVAHDEDYNFVPMLAESWDVSDDALTYTFHLRSGVTFSDGTPFDSSVVVTNYNEAVKKENGWRRRRTFVQTLDDGSENYRVAKVEAPDANTVVFTLSVPYSPFMNSISQFYLINPSAAVDPNYNYLAQSAGTGAFTLKEWVNGDHTTMVPNPSYWGEKPTVDSVTFREVPEAGARIAMLQTGEADFVYPTPSDQIATIKGAGDINLKAQKSTTMRYVTLNTNVKELSDVRVRQAMNYAFDQKAYAEVLYSGFADPATSVLPEKLHSYEAQTPYDVDLDKAKSLLKEAGYPDGFKLTLWGDNSTQETKGMTFVMQQMAQIGITVDVQPMEPATVADKTALPADETELQMWYVNWSQNDADGFLRSLLSSGMVPPTGYNTAFWKDDEFDANLEKGNAAPTQDEQDKYYRECQKIAWENCPWLFLATDDSLFSYKEYLKGVRMIPMGIDATHATLER
nr:ABC transporter substrate-binding protein [uncultured Olsenella sp.]